jgi:REP-associated tyrosine transposase
MKAEVPSAFMSRPLRLEYPGALFHITARGIDGRETYLDDVDRVRFLELLRSAVERFRWTLTAYVLMSNHFHLLIELTETTLSTGMKWLNQTYAQAFNQRHDRAGHLFQQRFRAPLIEKETYFLEVARYVVLNPVRARIVVRPEEYKWSSYLAMMGRAPVPSWLATDDLFAHFGDDREAARARYRAFVADGIDRQGNPWTGLVGQIYLGSESWIERTREKLELKPRSSEHPRWQRVVGRPKMSDILTTVAGVLGVDEQRIRCGRGGIPRMLAAWLGTHEGLLTNAEVAAGLRLRSSSRVTQLLDLCEKELVRSEDVRVAVDQCLATLRRNCKQLKT